MPGALGPWGHGAIRTPRYTAHEYVPTVKARGMVLWFAVQSTWRSCVVEHIHAHCQGPICYTATLYHLVRQCSDNLHRSPRTRKTNLHHLSGNSGSLTTCPAVSVRTIPSFPRLLSPPPPSPPLPKIPKAQAEFDISHSSRSSRPNHALVLVLIRPCNQCHSCLRSAVYRMPRGPAG